MGIVRKTAVVVPCFNEAHRFDPQAFLDVARAHDRLHFVFVDDGSTDDTPRVLTELCAQLPDRLTRVRLSRNSGKAEAVRQGMARAFELGAEVAGYWDADLATPLEHIEKFAAELARRDASMVIGSRVKLLGHRIERRAARHYIGRVFATMAALSLRLPVYDTQCGAKLFKVDPALRRVFARPFELRWCFDVEVLARLRQEYAADGHRDPAGEWVEYPLDRWTDVPGTKLTLRTLPGIVLELARLSRIARGGRR
jgi:dolichyl-phosphate beta-glucosyltransferase